VLAGTPAIWNDEAEEAMNRGIEARRGEPWFTEAQQAIEDEQAGAFSSVDDLLENVRRQSPLYFHRWEGNEQVGREIWEFAHAEPLRQFNAEFPTLNLSAELRAIDAPTLVVVADDDFIAGPVCAEAIVREVPDVRLVTIRDCGHFIYAEQPDAFRAALTDFLV
jgi:pimeloyl-ACP methyl ester carboxylesterase